MNRRPVTLTVREDDLRSAIADVQYSHDDRCVSDVPCVCDEIAARLLGALEDALQQERGAPLQVYLDDERPTPFGWHRVTTADDCILRLEENDVRALSLDHDLHPEHYAAEHWKALEERGYTGDLARSRYREKTGFAVIEWMIAHGIWPALIIVHTMNPVARAEMLRELRKHAPEGVTIEERVGFKG